jgi:hypothetical protein
VFTNLLYSGTTRRRRKCSFENQISTLGPHIPPGKKSLNIPFTGKGISPQKLYQKPIFKDFELIFPFILIN